MVKWEIIIPGIICFVIGIAAIVYAASLGTSSNIPNTSWTESQILGYPVRVIGEYIFGVSLIIIGPYLMNKGWKF